MGSEGNEPALRWYGVLLAALGYLSICPDSLLIRLGRLEQDVGCFLLTKYVIHAASMYIGLILYFGSPRALVTASRKSGWHFIFASAAVGLFYILWNLAVMTTSAWNAVALLGLSPMWGIIWTFLLTWERTPRYTFVAASVTLTCGLAIFVSSRSSSKGADSLLGDLLAVLAGMAFGLYLTICADASKKYPDASLMGAIAVGATIAVVASYMFVESHSFLDCHPKEGYQGYTWAATNGILETLHFVLLSLAAKHCPSAVVGLLLIVDLILEPYLVWIVLGEPPLLTTLVAGGVLCITLVVHELAAFHYEAEKALRES
mmetsp:Transcript_60612/g.112447  ORF Transcript_60612/g.112447 Transcript_60612/m.112447 type:complete len:317 (-) Transcript_60612:67-1017(-)